MGRASSSKKVARAASTGGGRTTRGARPVGWYAAILLVVALGVSGIVFSRAERRQEFAAGTDLTAPAPGRDHWHNAYGFYLCDAFIPPLNEIRGGIHTHNDGLIHIEPGTRREGGKNATLQRFLDGAGVEVTDTSIRVPGQKSYEEGKTKCGGKDGIVQMRVNDDPPISTGIASRKFVEGDSVTIAFAPKGAEIPAPPSKAALAEQLRPPEGQQTPPIQVPLDPNAPPPDPNAAPPAEGAPAEGTPPAEGGATPTSTP